MTEFKKLTPTLSVSAALGADDMEEVAAAGFKSVINNRPDYEDAGQESSDEIKEAAEACGLVYRHQPVMSGMVTDQNCDEFGACIGELEGPILAFCRSGTRSTTLWALCSAKAGIAEPKDLLETAAQAGYNLAPLRPRLEKLFATCSGQVKAAGNE